jgi:hypothetical protein
MDFTNKELDLLYRALDQFKNVVYYKNSEYIQTMSNLFGNENIIDPLEDEIKEINNLLDRLFEKLR